MTEDNLTERPWPLIHLCKEKGMIDELDLTLAKNLLKNEKDKKEEWALFLCHMSRSLREGSLAVSLESGKLMPSPVSIWKDKKKDPLLSPVDIAAVEEKIIEGFHLPASLVHERSTEKAADKPIIREGNRLYFQRSLRAEERFLQSMTQFLKFRKKDKFDRQKAMLFVEEMKRSGSLEEKQAQAALAFLDSAITLIMGGPGTGKTYTAAMIVRMLQQARISSEPYKIALAAPTGKAASNLKQALSKCGATEGIEEPRTLHSLLNLGYQSKEVKSPYQLSHDLYIIDEASMIDIELMTALLRSMKPTAKAIFLGDQNQLPPIDLGSPFSDIADAKDNLPPSLSCVELNVSIRCETKDILELSKLMLEGDGNKTVQFLKVPREEVEWRPIHDEGDKEILGHIVASSKLKYEWMVRENLTDTELFQLKSTFTVLTPFRVGMLGSEAINHAINKAFATATSKGAVPIIILENKPDLGLFNGDIGFLKEGHSGQRKAIFLKQNTVETIAFPEAILPKYEWAFCLSIHKSQGSEFQEALIVLPEGSEHFGKKIAYTALTRVKKRACLVAREETLCKILSEKTPRTSGIAEKVLQLSCTS
ncbi:exodeoxyribonuclease V subunit alpha [Estrella lausannensis]|uniref:Exodeoxyribonuclease V alpha subunit n=1 Tax=Estrella lausannensis TaxID=483423 RepID=A0A0H5DQE7_9BACT|nr:exodeoxyribonuclease V subunit alpha [Estrella lausannensis]CRX38871.1 Exodeoxyribonuclease V alpha subunit [Estrella lausannensis]